MISRRAARLALRNRALSLTVCTTGSTSLSATANGYARATGSFVTDGFLVGMELTPTGFASNPVDVITNVTALTMTVATARSVEVAASGRTLAVKLPKARAWSTQSFTPTNNTPYVEEDYVPASKTLAGQRDGGYVYSDGLYFLRWYGLSAYGDGAIEACVDALELLYAPGTALTAGSHILRVRTDSSVNAGQILPLDGGWSVITLTVPWRAESINAVAA